MFGAGRVVAVVAVAGGAGTGDDGASGAAAARSRRPHPRGGRENRVGGRRRHWRCRCGAHRRERAEDWRTVDSCHVTLDKVEKFQQTGAPQKVVSTAQVRHE